MSLDGTSGHIKKMFPDRKVTTRRKYSKPMGENSKGDSRQSTNYGIVSMETVSLCLQ